ncbi:hypothetical protein SLH46_19000 [Draconibacterium sp. IB214405]|uniref:hypothetical protein n=1 Tax=Draconibacterium sp. IB214405 TaxID=3097352 RepID=UPI002A0E4204|nr:hypothetical protein [Draconibacterium sp. IB214405]MDX8341295.1 hypothetical protein [Draconibacterium sp. IB214405]
MITFAAALREAQFIERMGYRTAKAGPVVATEISVFRATIRFKKKSFEKTLKSIWQKQNKNYLCSRFGNEATFKDKLMVKTGDRKAGGTALKIASKPQKL